MKHPTGLPQPYRVCGRTVYVYKGHLDGAKRVSWGFWLGGREPIEGFRTRKAALEQARKILVA
jgi:hypothetical protein